ncbi:MAG: hypothetical protein Q7R47_01295, partial [Candidatus Diapherotrites archaeon]|nr:hypothetical protein [Candidatus Diapherotrites archaeon]
CREHFKGREITNLLVVRWAKRPWKTKLGHIKPLQKNVEYGSLIEINPLLGDIRVPSYVLDVTLLHELMHYFHGFGSNRPRHHRHAHRGGHLQREFAAFGWTELLQKQEVWLKANWVQVWNDHRHAKRITS